MRLNKIVSQIFEITAQLLEVLGENPFRIRAYENAARRIGSMSDDLADYLCSDTLTELPGIGKDLADKIKEIYETGSLKFYEDLKKKLPSGLIELLKLQGLGPKKVKLLYEKLGIVDIESLKKAAETGKLYALPGFGKKTQENILKSIEFYRSVSRQHLLGEAIKLANEFIGFLREGLGREISGAQIAGSLRRFKETVHDIDILVISEHPKNVMKRALDFPDKELVIGSGEKKSSLVAGGIQIDLRVFRKPEFGSALLYFTGSKAHNIKLRQLCQDKEWKLNEYGLFTKDNELIASKTEEDIYSALGLQFIPPEIREDIGEVELAAEHNLPRLVDVSDVKGDLHMHTMHSDGVNTISEMANAAKLLGYEYISITDHSRSLKVANGLSRDRLIAQLREIKRLRREINGIEIFTGIEVDILSDGSLDADKDLLSELDVVIAAIHTGFKLTKSAMTKRITKALSSGLVNIFAHPNGRLLNVRDSYEVDLQEVFKVALDNNVAMEINSSPKRLDLNAENARKAADMGIKIAINTDSHRTSQLENMKLGVHTARRGWLKKEDIINCMDVGKLKEFLCKAKL